MVEPTAEQNAAFMLALEASSGSVPITAENVERRLKMRATLNQVWEAWVQRPNLRLGQLLDGVRYGVNGIPPMFYITDEELLTGVQTIVPPSSEDD